MQKEYIYPYQMGGKKDPVIIIQSGTKDIHVYGKVNTSTGEYQPPTLINDVNEAKKKWCQCCTPSRKNTARTL